MSPEDKALLSVLLDDEASPSEVESALALLESSPEAMEFLQRQGWLSAQWRNEYDGEPVDLSAGVWAQIDADAASDGDVVDELALRREARGIEPCAAAALPAEALDDAAESAVPAAAGSKIAALASATAANSGVERDAGAERKGISRVWQPLAQMAVAASVCFAVVGLWTYQGTEQTLPVNTLAANTSDARISNSQTAVATQLAALNNRATVASSGTLPSASNLLSTGAQPVRVGQVPAQALKVVSDGSGAQVVRFVSLDSLAEQERARIQAYYLMHTGNSAMMQPMQGMQLVRIVDAPEAAPQVDGQ